MKIKHIQGDSFNVKIKRGITHNLKYDSCDKFTLQKMLMGHSAN